MKQFVESVRRLYLSGAITKEKVDALYEHGTITESEKRYILD